MNPRVVDVKANDDYTLTIRFTNGEVRLFDMKQYLSRGVFRELRDLSYFRTVRPSFGAIQWPHEQDLCPDTLYEASVPSSKKSPKRRPLRTAHRR
jgi:hypothetical protein